VQLTRGRVIAAAMALIEAEGVQAASMTRLATELGCGLIALYGHVPSTQALLDGVAATVVSGIELSGSGVTAAPAACLTELRAQVRAARQAARAHPRCTMAVAGRPPATAAQLRPAEQMLGTLRAAGFGGADAVRIMRVLAAYLVGSLVREVGVVPGSRDDSLEGTRPVLRPASFPHLTALPAELAAADADGCPDGDFEFGLELLLRGIAALADPRPAGG
jgi:AcrR family transcriptional regulator